MTHRIVLLALLVAPWLCPWPASAAVVTRTETLTANAVVARPVNINVADVGELMTLSGIGRAVAERIVRYREDHGPFKTPEDLRRVKGVGTGLWERNKARIVVE